jgi:hypothetical protein
MYIPPWAFYQEKEWDQLNIFYLDNDTKTCAEMHVDKHCVKMILEYAQLLSTTHRLLDGTEGIRISSLGRKKRTWNLPDDRNELMYSCTHANHPSAVWTRASDKNYMWLADLLEKLCEEYTYRYGKVHKTQAIGLVDMLKNRLPNNIPVGVFTEPTPAMPEHHKVPGNSVLSYQNYYIGDKSRMFSWKKREQPSWIQQT